MTEIVSSFKSEDGYVVIVFSNDSLAIFHDFPPAQAVVLEAAAYFLPGRAPFLIRRSRRYANIVYVLPVDAEFEPLNEDELALLAEVGG